MVEYVDDLTENGDANISRWVRRVEECRQFCARLINADPHDLAFVKNTSEGVGLIAEGMAWREGDNVVIPEDEYPANVYPWMNLSSRGVGMKTWRLRNRRYELDDLAALIDEHTRLVSVSFVEYASGFRHDLHAIGQLCQGQNVQFFVDAIQGLGVLPLDVQEVPVDFLAADGHKWLLGPEGAGILFIRRQLLDSLRPVSVGWNSVVGATDFARIDFRLKPHVGRYECGTLNVAGISGLGASVELLLSVGIHAIRERVLALTEQLRTGLDGMGYDVYSSWHDNERSGIVSVVVPGEPREIVKRCRAAGMIVNHRAGRLRISPHAYNTAEEIEQLLEVLKG